MRLVLALALLLLGLGGGEARAQDTLLNASYDPTRELYRDINSAFAARWQRETGRSIRITMSHGGSGAQARAILDGLPADVATLALAGDIDALARKGLLQPDWQSRLPDNSTPLTSTIVLLVRAGNPKNIRDWPDLIRDGIGVVTPNPKTSGGARWNFLAAYAWALHQPGGNDQAATDYVRSLYAHVPVLDTGARGATTTFVQRGQGDVLIAWEDEALLARDELGAGKFDIVYPSFTILAEPPVAVIDKVAAAHGTTKVAEAYLRFLWTEEAQEIAARRHFRPRDRAVAAKHASEFPDVRTASVADFGGWAKAQPRFFADGALFDQITATH